jgi:WD40 repeat protein
MLWDPHTGKEIARLGPHCYRPLWCAYSADGSHIVSGTGVGSYGELWLWDGRTGEFILSFNGHTTWINRCLFTPDGKRVLSVSDDGTMRLWNVSTGEQIAILIDDRAHILKWDISPDGAFIAVGMDDHSVKVFNGKTGRLRATLIGHIARVSACAFSSDSKLLATGDSHYDSSLKIWDMDSFEERTTLREPHEPNTRTIEQCVFSPDCKLLFARSSVSSKDHLVVWDIASGLELERIVGSVEVLGFSPDQSLTLIGRHPLRLWDVKTLTEVARYLSTGAKSIAWHPGGSMLAVGDLSGDLHILQLENRATTAPPIEAPRKPRKPRAPRAPRAPDAPRAPRKPRSKVMKAEIASDAPASQPRVRRPRKTPATPEVVVEPPAQFAQHSTSQLIVDVPQAHPAANPNRAMELNLKYQEELKRWNALPWWKRLRVKKPVRPTGI